MNLTKKMVYKVKFYFRVPRWEQKSKQMTRHFAAMQHFGNILD